MKKNAFSVVELIMTALIFVIIAIALPIVLINQNNQKQKKQELHGTCDCYKGATSTPGCKVENSKDGHTICTLKAENLLTQDYTLELIGGGAGGRKNDGMTKYRGGGAGESKVKKYLGMHGVYCIRVGKGGAEGLDGEESIVVEFSDILNAPPCKKYPYDTIQDKSIILEVAKGGIANYETTTSINNQLGQNSIIDNSFGKGGNSGFNKEKCYIKNKNGICSSTEHKEEVPCSAKYDCKISTIMGTNGRIKISW